MERIPVSDYPTLHTDIDSTGDIDSYTVRGLLAVGGGPSYGVWGTSVLGDGIS